MDPRRRFSPTAATEPSDAGEYAVGRVFSVYGDGRTVRIATTTQRRYRLSPACYYWRVLGAYVYRHIARHDGTYRLAYSHGHCREQRYCAGRPNKPTGERRIQFRRSHSTRFSAARSAYINDRGYHHTWALALGLGQHSNWRRRPTLRTYGHYYNFRAVVFYPYQPVFCTSCLCTFTILA